MIYRVTWVGSDEGERVEASTPYKAWDMFYKRHPNFRDDEGDYYVNIEDEFGEPLLEAGVDKMTGDTFCLPHPDNV